MAIKQIRTITSKAVVSDGTMSGAIVDVSVNDTLYIKVERVSSTKDTGHAIVSLKGEKSQGLKDYEFQIDLNADNFIAQAYKHIKTLPEFVGAIDC
jgi:hypothetical protein